MYEEERLLKITEYVRGKTRASVQELCALFHVSESTVRRDLSELESQGKLKRTHGGAVLLESVSFEPTFSEKEDKYRGEKQRIAQKAAELISDGDSILIDAGTTTQYLAPELAHFRKLTVVTNSILLVQQMAGFQGVNVMATGGMLRKNTMALAGPIAEASLDRIRVDKAFIATNGLDARIGLTTPNIMEASIKQKMMEVADQVIVMADHSKVGTVSFSKFGRLSQVDAVVTGNSVPEEQVLELTHENIRVYLVEADR